MEIKQDTLRITMLYASKDREIANDIIKLLRANNCEVFTYDQYVKSQSTSFMEIGSSLDNFLKVYLPKSDVYMPLLTENSNHSIGISNEMTYALSLAKNKGLRVQPICIDDNKEIINATYLYISYFAIIYNSNNQNEGFLNEIEQIRKQAFAYRLPKLIEDYHLINNSKQTCNYITQLLSNYYQLLEENFDEDGFVTLLGAIYKYFYIYDVDWAYDNAKKEKYIVTVNKIIKYCVDVFLEKDIPYSQEKILKILHKANSVLNDYVYLEYGVNSGSDTFANYQAKLIEKYPELVELSESLIDEKYVKRQVSNAEEPKIQKAIADYLLKSNELFNLLRKQIDQPIDFYQCLKMSYERLKNYCSLIGDSKTGTLAVEKISELDDILGNNDFSSKETKSVKEFKAVLGLKNEEIGEYDVFISHKSLDADMASNVYKFLKGNMINPFFDKECLPDLGQAEYHEAIMGALDNSTHFIIVLSSLDYITSGWVREEMETFAGELREGRKNGNFIFVVTDEIMEEIKLTNKKCLPLQFRRFEVMLISEYQAKILSYLR